MPENPYTAESWSNCFQTPSCVHRHVPASGYGYGLPRYCYAPYVHGAKGCSRLALQVLGALHETSSGSLGAQLNSWLFPADHSISSRILSESWLVSTIILIGSSSSQFINLDWMSCFVLRAYFMWLPRAHDTKVIHLFISDFCIHKSLS